MPNPTLDKHQLAEANELLGSIRKRLDVLSGGDPELRFAFNRKIAKELQYDERGKPMERRALKVKKRKQQGGLCTKCKIELPRTYCVLDRSAASAGYTVENTNLICAPCDAEIQKSRRYR